MRTIVVASIYVTSLNDYMTIIMTIPLVVILKAITHIALTLFD